MNDDNPIDQAPVAAGGGADPSVSADRNERMAGANVGLLESVQLEAVLRFGERQLSLRELGKLRVGSVVELDKAIKDPAELLVGERVVARGEVVIVEGNYALRVGEVVAP
jgi:flagellar motor switch protein FliN/FliY